MQALQTSLRMRLKPVAVNSQEPLLACYHTGNFWIYYPQGSSPKVNTINLKGSLEDLYDLIPDYTKVYDVQNVDTRVFLNNRMVEVDRSRGKVSKEEFIQALIEGGAVEI